MTQAPGSGGNAEIMRRLAADSVWLAEQGAELGQWGPDQASGKVRIYLARYSEEARQLLTDRYGDQDIVVDTDSRRWRFTEGADKPQLA
jgi:hypothetical protein